MEKDLDCRGLACPQPVMRCRDLLTQEHPAVLRVLVDNAAASENVSRFLSRNGFATTVHKDNDDQWTITAQASSCQVTEADPEKSPDATGKTLVLITTPTLGRGDDTLGRKLMDNFLGSLAELGPALWRIVLLNGGVTLASMPGVALEHLKALQASGVDVLVCGTCLNHYGLLEQKQVGETTNMMDIVSSLALADKIIRP
ncbi:MAG: sulfurtransferase-like selenium metabolism protein YedF [Desulfovibrio sp.]|nr:sulfurtransferase-like selenium metabolism protein YedF [Desulfovibrio sp.]